ncbi:MAG TPA: hypothetical protein VFL55_24175, partial [Acetobacteraceae bacterium]|nr:hypothetical protein [Acetobacteraceae bacterium]
QVACRSAAPLNALARLLGVESTAAASILFVLFTVAVILPTRSPTLIVLTFMTTMRGEVQ